MTRPRVSLFLGLSLDGFIAGDDHNLDWLHDALEPTDEPEDTGFAAFMASVDVLVIGRNTYDVVLNFTPWPYPAKRVIVLTTRPAESKHGETFYNGPLTSLVEQLGNEGFKRVYLDGGITARQGLEEDLVDDMTLSWVPIVLGSGRPLFDRALPERRWTLKRSRAFGSGLVQAEYERARQRT